MRYFDYRLISLFYRYAVDCTVLKCIHDYSTTSSIAVCVITVDNNATYVHNNDTRHMWRMHSYGMVRTCQLA